MPSRVPTIATHRDADYPGHHDAEVNFWVPLVDVSEGERWRSMALWLETAPERADYRAVPLRQGEALRFNGSLCRHHTVPNASDRTRVSFDLRAIPASAVHPRGGGGGGSGSYGGGVTRIGDYDACFVAAAA